MTLISLLILKIMSKEYLKYLKALYYIDIYYIYKENLKK
jgi:hypothetical protein